MSIDLSKVIGYSKDSLQSRALMRAIMQDLYPNSTREMNVLLDVYESGIPRKIRNDRTVSENQFNQYVKAIINDYGLQEQYAIWGLNEWIKVCLDKEKVFSYGGESIQTFDNYKPPVVADKQPERQPIIITGEKADYDITDIGNGKAEIKKFKGFDVADMIVPNSICGLQIVGVGEKAYQSCLNMRKLTISDGIEYIKDGAFCNCEKLEDIKFPDSLIQIGTEPKGWGEGAFYNTKISSLVLPDSVKAIGHNSFGGCKELVSVKFPDNLEEIGAHAFWYCQKLDNVIFPSSTKIVNESAFESCAKLKNLKMNEGLEQICSKAFLGCGLSIVTIPSTVHSFGKEIFKMKYLRSSLVVRCYPGSKAIEFCRENQLAVENATT